MIGEFTFSSSSIVLIDSLSSFPNDGARPVCKKSFLVLSLTSTYNALGIDDGIEKNGETNLREVEALNKITLMKR